MVKAFKERRPWAAGVVTLFLGPLIGLLYLGRGRSALIWLFVSLIGGAALLYFIFPSIITHGNRNLANGASWGVNLIAAMVLYVLAKQPAAAPLPEYSRWYWLVAVIVAVIAPLVAIRFGLYQPFDAPSASMSPSINQGDYFFASLRAYDSATPERGDIVVFRWHGGNYVKRVAGIPGDRVQIVNGVLVLNGKPVPRRRIEDFNGQDFGLWQIAHQYEEILPSGRRYRTLDLIQNGPTDNTVAFVVPQGRYFVLGDNRDSSDDSRLGMGFIPRKDLVGKVAVKFADRLHATLIWQRPE